MNATIKPQPKQEQVKLFSEKQVVGTSAVAGIIAGAFLMVINFYRKGKKQEAFVCGVVGIVLTVVIALIAITVPQIPAPVFIVSSYFFAKSWYKNSQAALVKKHIREGGEIEKIKTVIGFSLIALVINLVISLGTIFAFEFFLN